MIVMLTASTASACASLKFPQEQDKVYSMAVEASLAGNASLANAAAYQYVLGSTTEDPRYDRALRLIARSSEELELSYAASIYYLEIAQARRDVELVGDAIRGLEQILRKYPYDEPTIETGFLATEEITGLPFEEQAFVDYYQGLDSIQQNFDDWGAQRFAQIPQSSPYYARAQYVLAVRLLARSEVDAAKAAFEQLLAREDLPEDVGIDCNRTLARLAYSERDFELALKYYDKIRATAPNDPQLLLEMAWTHYQLGQSHRALGLLVALDAPAFAELIAPERFLLEALALRRLCQFEPARRAAVRLRERLGAALTDLHDGVPLQQSEALRAAAGLRTTGRPVAEFHARLKVERAMLDELEDSIGPALHKHLVALYDRALVEAQRRENELLGAEMEALAEELLAAEEGVRLILHELGVALLRGRGRPEGPPEQGTFAFLNLTEPVFYLFEGEFWTDELDDLVVTIEDRCID
ncbi:MAG: hypothetical protein RBU37_08405 [Myxococcota bacterium]|nr:hypothetical protein [Myxococcota bacterium]